MEIMEGAGRMAAENFPIVTIYTDGGCDPNPGRGGWAAVLISGGRRKEISDAENNTTNNRMEMTAAIRALESLKKRCVVNLYTDSQYLKLGVTEWMPSWKKRNWIRKGGELKNLDLWQTLDALIQKHNICWHWVKGHAGHPENERCDQLVARAINKTGV